MANNTTKKEQFLLKNGRKQETIDFCKKCGITQDHIVWFVDRIEKDKFDYSDLNSIQLIKKVFKAILRENKLKEIGSVQKLIEYVQRFYEDEDNVKSRILHSFDDKYYIINLTPKELELEGQDMRNCVGDKVDEVKNKEYSILALKDEKGKTVCHFQIERNGSLSQHYGKANSTVKSKYWKYVIEFFKIYEDKNFVSEIQKSNSSIKYSIDLNDRQYNYMPVIESYIPTAHVVTLFREEEKQVVSKKFLKDFVNTNDFNETIQNSNIEEVKEYLEKYKEYLSKSIDDLFNMVKDSSDNYLILSDDIVKKIFGKIYLKPNEKNLSIINNQDKMILSYDEYNDYLEDYPIPVRDNYEIEPQAMVGRYEATVNEPIRFRNMAMNLEANPAMMTVRRENILREAEDLCDKEELCEKDCCETKEDYDEKNEMNANQVGFSFNASFDASRFTQEIKQEEVILTKKIEE
jgi:hypothetical protein